MGELALKPVTEAMLPELTNIYNYYILNTTVTFHGTKMGTEEMRQILFDDDPRFPSYAILDGDELYGYCILAHFKKREAYDSTAEVTVYLKNGLAGHGIGTFAVSRLEEIALQNGFHALLAVICAENEASVRLFAKLGYEKCAHYKEVGIKFGRMLDVVTYQKILGT